MNSQRPRSLADYCRIVLRRKVAIIVPAFVLASAVALALRELPSVYQSTVRMRVSSNRTDATPDLSSRLQEFRQLLNSRETLEELISMSGSGDEPSDIVLSQTSGRIAVELDARREAQPGAFSVSFRASDPEKARKATDLLALRLMNQSPSESSALVSQTNLLRKRAADLSIQMRELEERDPWLTSTRSDLSGMRAFQPAGGSSLETARAQRISIEGLKDQQYKTQQQLTDVARRIAAQRQIVEQQKKGSTLRDNPTYAILIAKRTELQGQRDTLINRQELTDKHPRVLAIGDQISAINRQIEELRQQDNVVVSQSPEARELAALEAERNRLTVDLEVTGRDLVRRSANSPVQGAAPESSQARRSAAASKKAEQYLGLKRSCEETANELQLADAKLGHADSTSPALQVLEPATRPEHPVFPNRPLLFSLTAVLGLAVGLAFAFSLEVRRFGTLMDAGDVEYYTRLPLLAAIPRAATATGRSRARWRVVGRIALGTAASTIALLVLTRIFVAADIFALIARK